MCVFRKVFLTRFVCLPSFGSTTTPSLLSTTTTILTTTTTRVPQKRLTFGYPAVEALSLDRQAYAVMHGSFSDKAVTAFLHGVMTGRQSTMKLPSSVSMESLIVPVMEPWDGLDAAPNEEEMSLEDIMGWGDDDDTTENEKKASNES
jgi:hypothetical protein